MLVSLFAQQGIAAGAIYCEFLRQTFEDIGGDRRYLAVAAIRVL